ncbi:MULTISPECIES: trypsin-like peptidase domain-containing protein [unclassified Staphylococcus]|uniref:S1C family serine protease n=1 Tax=unclassified Staphylococcus TaxID=91994 RepID=UPI0021CF7440|nr:MULTISPECIES: trypsin-like peptidase domain-containing protein [unclassified Staphylococcus]UXR75443.1 trypsin-like peptidase domain-containing protein [Staphylococcus sp. IVB6233]UXR79646.1 trypsin-like peptidase domain-containing protein [Staphylococcus sp. IVB6218]
MNSNDNHQNSQTQPYQTPPPRQQKPSWLRLIISALIAGLVGGMIAFGAMNGVSKWLPSDNQSGANVNVAENEKGGNLQDNKSKSYASVNEMIQDKSPSIVGVINEQKAESLEDLLRGKSTDAQPSGIGSGVIYQLNQKDAYIVTNNHVIDGATSIKVQLHNSKQVSAELVGTDPLTDIAVLKIKNRNDIKAIDFADSSKVKTGDSVFAMGNPLGLEFANTVTSGIISASERTIDAETSAGTNKVTVLQTDAAINPGNSGGALVDLNGNLVGINSMKISAPQVEGIGFAIPSNEVKLVIEQLVKHGEVKRPSVGIGMLNVADIPASYKKKLDADSGVYVAEVQRSNSSLKSGDIITEIDGKKVENDSDLRAYLYKNKQPGDTVTFTIKRNGQTQKVDVALAESR